MTDDIVLELEGIWRQIAEVHADYTRTCFNDNYARNCLEDISINQNAPPLDRVRKRYSEFWSYGKRVSVLFRRCKETLANLEEEGSDEENNEEEHGEPRHEDEDTESDGEMEEIEHEEAAVSNDEDQAEEEAEDQEEHQWEEEEDEYPVQTDLDVLLQCKDYLHVIEKEFSKMLKHFVGLMHDTLKKFEAIQNAANDLRQANVHWSELAYSDVPGLLIILTSLEEQCERLNDDGFDLSVGIMAILSLKDYVENGNDANPLGLRDCITLFIDSSLPFIIHDRFKEIHYAFDIQEKIKLVVYMLENNRINKEHCQIQQKNLDLQEQTEMQRNLIAQLEPKHAAAEPQEDEPVNQLEDLQLQITSLGDKLAQAERERTELQNTIDGSVDKKTQEIKITASELSTQAEVLKLELEKCQSALKQESDNTTEQTAVIEMKEKRIAELQAGLRNVQIKQETLHLVRYQLETDRLKGKNEELESILQDWKMDAELKDEVINDLKDHKEDMKLKLERTNEEVDVMHTKIRELEDTIHYLRNKIRHLDEQISLMKEIEHTLRHKLRRSANNPEALDSKEPSGEDFADAGVMVQKICDLNLDQQFLENVIEIQRQILKEQRETESGLIEMIKELESLNKEWIRDYEDSKEQVDYLQQETEFRDKIKRNLEEKINLLKRQLRDRNRQVETLRSELANFTEFMS